MDHVKHIVLLAILLNLIACPCQAFGAAGTRQPDWLTPWSTPQQTVTTVEPDYLNPFAVERPEWDPYAPFDSKQMVIERIDPIAEGLSIKDELRLPNVLYVQEGGMLTTRATVILGDPIILWVRISVPGNLLLYDNGRMVYSTGLMMPGWYRITGAHADLLVSHLYVMRVGGLLTNNASVLVDPGRYPTTYSLVGRVVDQNGAGVPWARVIISGGEGGSFTINTDMLGYYGMNLPSGYYVITAASPGYIFSQVSAKVWLGTVSAAPTIVGIPTGQPVPVSYSPLSAPSAQTNTGIAAGTAAIPGYPSQG
ncbi:MAG: carboxypeptidase-like regulatory domain-containing protein [Methanothrix sp.]|uniref:carboxypeptidase-like regulatory domain-containing protein n=1 Tax=Methanothrix sp. TaxID=90426 RepID=UPI0032AF38AD|nr:carboxypeptidase-like regulatory domain-containing protein [Methanothrix sp.]